MPPRATSSPIGLRACFDSLKISLNHRRRMMKGAALRATTRQRPATVHLVPLNDSASPASVPIYVAREVPVRAAFLTNALLGTLGAFPPQAKCTDPPGPRLNWV